MKKVLLASLLAVACAVPLASKSYAQQGVQMSQEEYKVYNDAVTAATPVLKAQGLEGYLKAYPNSAVKLDVLNQIVFNYSQTGDATKILESSDNLLAVDPSNLRAITLEVYYRRPTGDALTDAAAKAAALDVVAGYAQKGLTIASGPAPKGTSADDWKTVTATAIPIMDSAIADDDIAKKDNAGAIAAIKAEVKASGVDSTTKPGIVLQDVVYMAQAYMTSTPPDYLDCAWYAARAAAFAGSFAAQITPTAKYCYTKYHGNSDGFDKLQTMVTTSFDPPADLGKTITPAPKPEDIVANLIATTPDLSTLAVSDREFVLQYGKKEDADKAFDSVKGKSVQFPDALVVAATDSSVQVAITDDAIQSKTADFTFTMTTPFKTVPAVGSKVTLTGTYASYTPSPLMITMSDGEVVEPKKAPVKKPAAAPAHHAPVKKK